MKITVSANDFEICDSNGIIFQTEIRQTMRGTNSANTTTPPTVGQIQAEIEENGASLLDTIRDELANGTDGLSALKTLLDAIKVPTDKMVFTKVNELDVNAKSFNDAEIIGDGNATPWDGA